MDESYTGQFLRPYVCLGETSGVKLAQA